MTSILLIENKINLTNFLKELDVKFEEIYDPEDSVYAINGDYAHGNFGNNHTFNANSEFVFETMKKYILKLEEENASLKAEIAGLKKQNFF